MSQDKLEDKLIGHPDSESQQPLRESLDESFQKRLQDRADQFSNRKRDEPQFFVTRQCLRYNHAEFSLESELAEWFTRNDLKSLVGQDGCLYHVFGEYKLCTREEQLPRIIANCNALAREPKFVYALDDSLTSGVDLFQRLTVTYFVVTCCLDTPPEALLSALSETNLITKLITAIDRWNQTLDGSLRIRNLIMLLSKLILLELGGDEQLKEADAYLREKYKCNEKQDMALSTLDYHSFKEDLKDKYPTHSSETDAHNEFMALNTAESSSKVLEMPLTNKTHLVLGQLPVQTLHISSQVPSPPSTPSDFMSGGEKIRKSYHVHQGVPLVYPDSEVPEAVIEAQKLLEASFYESYSAKRLWKERQKYIKQERGCDEYALSDSEDMTESNPIEAKLERVERLYASSLPHLHTLMQVFVHTLELCKWDFNLKEAEQELDPETLFATRFGYGCKLEERVIAQLETQRAKEICVKAGASIMYHLLKWFKLNHVLQFTYLSTLLFNEGFFETVMDYLSRSFDNSDLQDPEDQTQSELVSMQNKLMNPPYELDFFGWCHGNEAKTTTLINRTSMSLLPCHVDELNKNVVDVSLFNPRFAHSLVNLLRVTNKIVIKRLPKRVFALSEQKPTELLKLILTYDNDAIRLPILKMLKKLTPYQGRKWRALNMDLVSQIYLHLQLTLKDTFLSGRDLETDFGNANKQEAALASLLQFYNMRRYPRQMEALGLART